MSIHSDIPGTVYTQEWNPDERLDAPMYWPEGQTVKVSDIFSHSGFVGCVRAIKVMAEFSSHTFIVTTKNPAEMEWFFNRPNQVRQPQNLAIVISRDYFKHAFAEVLK